MNELDVMSDLQFKHNLRRERDELKELLEMLENKEYEHMKEKLQRHLQRVQESLQH